jgi:hypothetical protein
MIYRILVDLRFYRYLGDGSALLIPPRELGYPEEQRLLGGSFGNLCGVMRERGLKEPCISNQRARFYFTEAGWEQVGRYVAAQARQDGHIVRVLRLKNPHPSQVIYQDDLQLALLPRNSCSRRRRTTD